MPSRRRLEPSLRVLKPKGKGPDTTDLAKLEAAVNATSQRAVAQWVAFLSLWAYLFFTTLSVTDRDLILLTPVKLPLIGVELGLQAFFWVGPPLFWVFHLYLTRKVVVLAADIAFYRDQISRQIRRPDARVPLLQRLDAFFLTRWLGYPEQGNGLRLLDGIIAAATCAVLPLVLMMTFQIRFLAFHDVQATWWHRGWAFADLGIVVFLIAKALRTRINRNDDFSITETAGRALKLAVGRALVLPVAMTYIFTALFVATVPDETITRIVDLTEAWKSLPPSLMLPRNLEPRDTDFVNNEKLDKIQVTIDLRNRDFRNAQLSNADMRKANLREAQFQGANLKESQLQGADLSKSQLQGANLRESQLQGTNLWSAHLQGANISLSHLQGANLGSSQLQGAILRGSQLQGANLASSQLQGSDLRWSQLKGASLKESQLQGADLSFSRLQGVDLSSSQLQGANLKQSQLHGTDLSGASLWRTSPPEIKKDDYFIIMSYEFRPIHVEDYQLLYNEILSKIPAGGAQDAAKKRLEVLSGTPPEESDESIAHKWMNIQSGKTKYTKAYEAYSIFRIACFDDQIIFASNLVDLWQNTEDHEEASVLETTAFAKRLIADDCPNGKKLSDDDRARLQKLATPQ